MRQRQTNAEERRDAARALEQNEAKQPYAGELDDREIEQGQHEEGREERKESKKSS